MLHQLLGIHLHPIASRNQKYIKLDMQNNFSGCQQETAEKSSRSLAQGDASHVYYLGGAAATMPLYRLQHRRKDVIQLKGSLVTTPSVFRWQHYYLVQSRHPRLGLSTALT